MPDIFHDFPIAASAEEVFRAVATSEGLNNWWTKRSGGEPEEGETYVLWFGPEWDWRAQVTACTPGREFELTLTQADEDWVGTVIGFRLEEKEGGTKVHFSHTGWPSVNEHYRRSNYCWAMYLRVLKRFLEHGETVPYEDRNDV